MIRSEEARQLSIDMNKKVKELSNEAMETLEFDIDNKVKEAAKRGELQCTVSLRPIHRLNEINIEAAKRTVHYLGALLESFGYRYSRISNMGSSTVEIYWDLR